MDCEQNAAIGGPATAAAFCGQMRPDLGKLQGRTISATVWGVVGYAIGTIVGVSMMYRIGLWAVVCCTGTRQ